MNFSDVAFVKYQGVKVSNICYRNVLETVSTMVEQGTRGYICLTDVSNLIAATTNESLRRAINESFLSLADGTPLVWYAWLVGCKEIERISGASLLHDFLADLKGCRHYLLGDTERTIERVIAKARQINPDIQITGYSPPFKEFDAEDNRQMIDRIKMADADLIWVCFGGVKQECWMKENLASLDRGVMIGVGAAFRFLIGDIVTPPLIFQKMGLQWLFRLVHEFVRTPLRGIKIIHQRNILGSKVSYLVHLPKEVKVARRALREKGAG